MEQYMNLIPLFLLASAITVDSRFRSHHQRRDAFVESYDEPSDFRWYANKHSRLRRAPPPPAVVQKFRNQGLNELESQVAAELYQSIMATLPQRIEKRMQTIVMRYTEAMNRGEPYRPLEKAGIGGSPASPNANPAGPPTFQRPEGHQQPWPERQPSGPGMQQQRPGQTPTGQAPQSLPPQVIPSGQQPPGQGPPRPYDQQRLQQQPRPEQPQYPAPSLQQQPYNAGQGQPQRPPYPQQPGPNPQFQQPQRNRPPHPQQQG